MTGVPASRVEAPAIIHIAGPVCGFGSVWRQRCQWCGGLIQERDLANIAVLESGREPERRGKPLDVDELGWWDGLVAMAGTFPAMAWAVEPDDFYEDGIPKVPPRMCMVLLPDEMTTAAQDDAPSQTWSVWSEADYYGPHLQSLHATEESAMAEAARRNDEHWPERPASHNWPFVVEKHEVLP